jgi:hypothetical protein
MLRSASLTMIFALAAALGGCRSASIRPDAGKAVQVLSITPVYKNDGGADFKVLMSLADPRGQAGIATRVSWRIWIQRRWFAEGEQVVSQPIAAGGTTRLELVLPLALRRAPAPAELVPVELMIRGELTAMIGGVEETLGFARTLVVNAPSTRLGGVDED